MRYLFQFRLLRLLVLARFGCLAVELLGRELIPLRISGEANTTVLDLGTLRLNSAFSRPDMVVSECG